MSFITYHWCLVPECKNTSVKTPQKLWIQVPSDIKRRNTWLKLARRDPKSLSTKTKLYYCEDHFDLENDMENYTQYKIMGSVKRIRMKPNCVPSRFDCQANRKYKSTSKEPRRAFMKMQRISMNKEIEETIQNENYVTSLPSCSQEGPLSPETLKIENPTKTYSGKSFSRQEIVEKLSLSHKSEKTMIDPKSATGSELIKAVPEEGGRGSPGEAGPLRGAGGAAVKVELFEVDGSRSTRDQQDDDGVVSYFNSLRNEENSNNDALKPHAREVPKDTHQHYKCNACGGPIEGFRYACVQCEDYDQCAECEASGAHAEHYVLRVPRVERAAELQTAMDRIRRELMQVIIPVKVEMEEDEVAEEGILVLSTVPVELIEVDPIQCSGVGAGAGGGAVKQEVIDPEDSDMPACGQVPVTDPSLAGEASHFEARAGGASRTEAVDQFPEMPWLEAGVGAVKQEAFDTDEDWFECSKFSESPGTTCKLRATQRAVFYTTGTSHRKVRENFGSS